MSYSVLDCDGKIVTELDSSYSLARNGTFSITSGELITYHLIAGFARSAAAGAFAGVRRDIS